MTVSLLSGPELLLVTRHLTNKCNNFCFRDPCPKNFTVSSSLNTYDVSSVKFLDQLQESITRFPGKTITDSSLIHMEGR